MTTQRPTLYCIFYIIFADYLCWLACMAIVRLTYHPAFMSILSIYSFLVIVLFVAFGALDVILSRKTKSLNLTMPFVGFTIGFATIFFAECILWIPTALYYVGIETDLARKMIALDSFSDSLACAYRMSKPTSTILGTCFFAVHFYNKLALFVFRDALVPAARACSTWYRNVFLKYNKK